MKYETFVQVQDTHPALFGNYTWDQLKTNNDLAIETLAYRLADIEHHRTADQSDTDWKTAQAQGDVLPATWKNTDYKRDEMAALAINQGATTAVDFVNQDPSVVTDFIVTGLSLPFAPTALLNTKSYLDEYVAEFNLNWSHADGLFCDTGAFTCTN